MLISRDEYALLFDAVFCLNQMGSKSVILMFNLVAGGIGHRSTNEMPVFGSMDVKRSRVYLLLLLGFMFIPISFATNPTDGNLISIIVTIIVIIIVFVCER